MRAPNQPVDIGLEDLEITRDPHVTDRWTVLAPGQMRVGSHYHWIPEGASLSRIEVAASREVIARWDAGWEVRVARVHARVAALPEHHKSVDITGLDVRTASAPGEIALVEGDEVVQRVTVDEGTHLLIGPNETVAPGTRLALIDVVGQGRPPAVPRDPIELRIGRVVHEARHAPERGLAHLIKLVGDDPQRAWPQVPGDLRDILTAVAGRPRAIQTYYQAAQPIHVRLQQRAEDTAWWRFTRGLRAIADMDPA